MPADRLPDPRLELIATLLSEQFKLVPDERRSFAAVLAEAIGRQIDHLIEESRAAGFNAGVEAARAAAQPDAILAALRERQNENLTNMLRVFVQIAPVVEH
jgi:hypothetical protein